MVEHPLRSNQTAPDISAYTPRREYTILLAVAWSCWNAWLLDDDDAERTTAFVGWLAPALDAGSVVVGVLLLLQHRPAAFGRVSCPYRYSYDDDDDDQLFENTSRLFI